MIDTPIARNTDPLTSHLAADHLVASGALSAQQSLAFKAVEQYRGLTSLEIADKSTLCRFMLAKRLPELERTHQVRRGQARRCKISGRLAATWWMPGDIEQATLFNKERSA